ncbi:MAG: hypothetical protein H7210_12095 [Pyrinomonadaceae bacterium]|nr:hypothetical protein [Phycisphaerales bacterium]
MFAKQLLAVVGLACLTASAHAQTGRLFVGENGSDPKNLPFCYETDLNSAFPASVSWAPTFQFAIQGAACTPQNLIYFTTGTFDTDLYVTIPGRPPTKAADLSESIFDMGYVNGKLYGWAQYATPSGIYEINPDTGVCTLAVASTSELFFALDGNPADGLLYGYSEYGQSGLYSIDPVTGDKHRISSGPVGQFPEDYGMTRGLAFGNNTVYLTNVWNADPVDTYYAYDITQGDNGAFMQFANPYANSTPQLGGSFWYDPSVVPQPPYPGNDQRPNATPVGEGTFGFNTSWAETDGDSNCAFGASYADVWFLYTPTYSHFAQFSTVSDITNFDTVMSIYTADGSSELDCNDDSGNFSLGSTIGYNVTIGQPILIRIAGWDYGPPSGIQRGPGELSIGECPDITIISQPASSTITRCMVTNPEDGSQGPFFVIVSTEIAPQVGIFTYTWEKDGVPLVQDFNGTFDVHGILIQNSGFFSRVVVIRPNATDAGEYRCIITSEDACQSPLSATTNAATLSFCAADFSCDGLANSQDFFDFLAAFFGNAPAADFNADGSINSQDFFDFLAVFFAGC